MYSVFSKKKVFTTIFPLKPSLKRATNLKRLQQYTIGVGKIAQGGVSGGKSPSRRRPTGIWRRNLQSLAQF